MTSKGWVRQMTTKPMLTKSERDELKYYNFTYLLMYFALKYRSESNIFYADRFQEIFPKTHVVISRYAIRLADMGYIEIVGSLRSREWFIKTLKSEECLESLDLSVNIDHPSWDDFDNRGAYIGKENNEQ